MSDSPETLTSPDIVDRLVAVLPLSNSREMVRFVKFSVVGAIGFVIDFGAFNILNALGWLQRIEISLPLVRQPLTGVGVANMISFTLAVISNFLWNRYWTYPDSRSKPIVGQFVSFYAINVVGLVIRTPILEGLRGPFANLLRGQLGLAADVAVFLGNNLALAVGVVIVLFWNFFVNRYITYSDVD